MGGTVKGSSLPVVFCACSGWGWGRLHLQLWLRRVLVTPFLDGVSLHAVVEAHLLARIIGAVATVVLHV